MASVAEYVRKIAEDALWPLKMFRAEECDVNETPSSRFTMADYTVNHADFSDPTQYRSQDKYRLLNPFAEEGEQLCLELRGGMGLVLNTAEQEEIRNRYENEAIKQGKEGSYGVEKEWKQLPAKTVGSFYGEKFRRIIQEQSRLSLLHEDGLISEAAYQKGIAATVHDLDRLGFHGFGKMIEATPALKDYLLSDATLRADTIAEALTARERWQGGDRLQEKLRRAEAQLPQNPDAVEEVYQEFLGGERIKATRNRIGYADEWLAKYEQYKERLETPNAALYEAMKSADATVRREAEKTFLMKHFYPITDPRLGEKHPPLKPIQRHLLTRIMEESHIKDKTIEELFTRPESPYATPGIFEGEAEVVADMPPPSLANSPQSSAGKDVVAAGEVVRERGSKQQQQEPPHEPPTPREPVTLEGEWKTEETAPANATKAEQAEEAVGTAMKKAFFTPKKLAFGTCAIALVGTLGWLMFKRTQEEKNLPSGEKIPSR